MIYHKSKQVGFIEHGEANIDKIMHNGNCVFSQGFDRDNSGTSSVVLEGTIGKDLMDWSIVGNTYQASIPSPSSPVPVLGVGDRTGNLFELNYLKELSASESGRVIKYNNGFRYNLSEGANNNWGAYLAKIKFNKIGVYAINASINDQRTDTTQGQFGFRYRSDSSSWGSAGVKTINVTTTDEYYTICFYVGMPTTSGGYVEVTDIMLNSGSTPLPYEMFGYKIPFVSKSENEITIIGIQPTTNYAYFNRNVMPDVKVGDNVMVYINNNSYKLNVMQIDDNYIYIENKVV